MNKHNDDHRPSVFDPPGVLMAIAIWATVAALAFGLSGCVNGKLSPLVAPIVSALDTAGCELVTVYVSDQEAGDVCDTASKFFNGILAGLSGPASVKAVAVEHKFPVRLGWVTVGHFYRPFDAMVQGKLDDLQADAGVVVADGGTR